MRATWLLALASCATTPDPVPSGGPRGVYASEHLDQARRHDQLARESARWPETEGGPGQGVPWVRAWDPAKEHEQIAAMHRSRAAALQAAYEEACGDRPLEEVSVSPLQRYAIGVWNTSSGVIMYLLPDAGPPDRLLADMKCHRAWMMLAPANMENCPLDLPGIQLDARGEADAITVSIAAGSREQVEELQRRAAHELEAAKQARKR
jgi:hypothetical protein